MVDFNPNKEIVKFENKLKYLAIIKYKNKCKTGTLFFLTPPNDPLIKQLNNACKLENSKTIRKAKEKKAIITSMPDVIGGEITIGTWVAFCKDKMRVGKVVKFTAKMMIIEDKFGNKYSPTYSTETSIVNESQLIMWKLSN